MKATRFDDVASALALLTTRRLTLAALPGAMLGSSIHAEARRTSGKCKPTCGACEACDKGKCKKKHGRKKRCKKGTCKALSGTACTLASGAAGTCCSGVCRDLQTDGANCGTCDGACTPTQVCQSGLCFPVSTCPATTTVQCDPLTTSCGDGGGTCVCNQSTEGHVVCRSGARRRLSRLDSLHKQCNVSGGTGLRGNRFVLYDAITRLPAPVPQPRRVTAGTGCARRQRRRRPVLRRVRSEPQRPIGQRALPRRRIQAGLGDQAG